MALLIIHAAATWFMVGLIWMVQVVHYPLFHMVGSDGSTAYEAAHTRRMGMVLALPAGVEVVTAAALVPLRPAGVPLGLVVAAGALLAAVWVITAAVQVPLHRQLSAGFDTRAIRRLVAGNWWRTAAWSLRGALAAAMLFAA